MNSHRNAYANPLERAYVVTVHQRRSNETFYTLTKG